MPPFDPDHDEVSTDEVKRRLDAGEPLFLLDVREPIETAAQPMPGAVAIPLGSLPTRLAEIPSDRPILTICHLGGRSWQAMAFLRAKGYPRAWSMAGGMHEWARRIERAPRS